MNEIRYKNELCMHEPLKYQKKVDSISHMFHLKGKNRLKGDNCPVYLVGKFQKTPIIMFGINPGYSSINNPAEEREARKSWYHYQELYNQFFKFFAENRFESPYYTAWGYFLAGLLKKKFSKDKMWKLFDTYFSNVELIPYHSEGISLPSTLSESQLEYLKTRYKMSVDFITRYNPKLLIFNGKIWHVLLIMNNLIQTYERIEINTKFNIYFYKLNDIPCVLFDRFFQSHFWGISNHERYVAIPNCIHNHYQDLSTNLSM
jgi:hypothetical protein